MLVANKPQIEKDVKTFTGTIGERRQIEGALKDIAFVLKMTAKVKGEILAGR